MTIVNGASRKRGRRWVGQFRLHPLRPELEGEIEDLFDRDVERAVRLFTECQLRGLSQFDIDEVRTTEMGLEKSLIDERCDREVHVYLSGPFYWVVMYLWLQEQSTAGSTMCLLTCGISHDPKSRPARQCYLDFADIAEAELRKDFNHRIGEADDKT